MPRRLSIRAVALGLAVLTAVCAAPATNGSLGTGSAGAADQPIPGFYPGVGDQSVS